MKALAEIGKRDGVQVNSINPGSVDTDRFRHRLGIIMARTGLDEAAAIEHHRKRTQHHAVRPARGCGCAGGVHRLHARALAARRGNRHGRRPGRAVAHVEVRLNQKGRLKERPSDSCWPQCQFERALRVLDRRLVIPAAASRRLDGLRRSRFRSRRHVLSDAGDASARGIGRFGPTLDPNSFSCSGHFNVEKHIVRLHCNCSAWLSSNRRMATI